MIGSQPRSGMIDFQSALKAVQNLIAQLEFVSIRVEVRSAANEGMGGAQSSSASHFAAVYFCLEGVSQADKVPLHEVVPREIGKVIGSLGEYPEMGSKPIFKSAANAAQHAIR